MAIYYWTGKVSTSVTDADNWTTYAPSGICGATYVPPSATQPPRNYDTAIFQKLITTGNTAYPLNYPVGTFTTSNTGFTAASLGSVIVSQNYPLGLGAPTGSTSTLNFYAKSIIIQKGTTNGFTAPYRLNLLQEPIGNTAASTLDVLGLSPQAINLDVKGVGTIKSSATSTTAITYANINIHDFAGRIGPFSNINGGESITVNSSVSMDQGPIDLLGKYNSLFINKGFATYNSPESAIFLSYQGTDGKQSINFQYENQTGTGPEFTARSTVGIICNGANATSQTISVGHGVDFTGLRLYSGTINFINQVNQVSRIYEGVAYTDASSIYILDPKSVVFMPVVGSYKGFFIANNNSSVNNNVPIKIAEGTNARIQLTADDNFINI
jgi:hypothetical protein